MYLFSDSGVKKFHTGKLLFEFFELVKWSLILCNLQKSSNEFVLKSVSLSVVILFGNLWCERNIKRLSVMLIICKDVTGYTCTNLENESKTVRKDGLQSWSVDMYMFKRSASSWSKAKF